MPNYLDHATFKQRQLWEHAEECRDESFTSLNVKKLTPKTL